MGTLLQWSGVCGINSIAQVGQPGGAEVATRDAGKDR